MNEARAQRILVEEARRGRDVLTLAELGELFGEDPGGTRLRGTVARLVRGGALVRALRGVYVCVLLREARIGDGRLRTVAAVARGERVTVEALYSAASRWGLVNQVPYARVTCVTTGRGGSFQTPLGRIDYTHTEMSGEELLGRSIDDGSPLRLADRELTLEMLRRTGLDRIYDLVNEDGDDLWEA